MSIDTSVLRNRIAIGGWYIQMDSGELLTLLDELEARRADELKARTAFHDSLVEWLLNFAEDEEVSANTVADYVMTKYDQARAQVKP